MARGRSRVCEPTRVIELTSALVASAGGDRVGVAVGLEPVSGSAVARGRAFTVRGAADDNLALHRAVAEARAGDLIVLAAGGSGGAGLCGELLALAAQRRGVAGIVVDGAIRDVVAIARLGFPVFHRGTSPATARKAVPGELRVPVAIAGVRVEYDDLVVADADGIAVVPARDAESVLADAAALLSAEERTRARIEAGESTLDILGL